MAVGHVSAGAHLPSTSGPQVRLRWGGTISQWWSNLPTHTPQMLQCLDRTGRTTLQVRQIIARLPVSIIIIVSSFVKLTTPAGARTAIRYRT